MSTEEILTRFNVLTRSSEVTLAGMLVLGAYPQQFFPQPLIDFTVHPGVRKSMDTEERFSDRTHCDGRIPDAVEPAVKAAMASLKVRHVEQGAVTVAQPKISEMVIREAITNAVAHRNYSFRRQGTQVAMDVYSDRIEISNPGELWGDRTLDNIDDGRSVSRDKILSKILSITPSSSGGGAVGENQGV
ncbi:ATP-binding protein [Corynebacterium uterequi]|uniref:ATP-dependent DNA helicase recG C-terminal n=1 Tax=Corynebacterium uterequi TaxID=1072256 RepID=A0A0G3HH25_9CORY|nr:ATP-binding protein [Corynebacterium uterequi]AKK12095.1 ATP-dependent DNA helicase recG C-terminal [Corynebacterium uterequi]